MAGDFRLGLGVSLLDEAMMTLVGQYVGGICSSTITRREECVGSHFRAEVELSERMDL